MVTVNTIISNTTLSEETEETLKRNIQFFCQTPRGSLPQMRSYGISYDFLGEDIRAARRKLTVDIISGLREFFGLRVKEINIEPDAETDGGFIIRIVI